MEFHCPKCGAITPVIGDLRHNAGHWGFLHGMWAQFNRSF
jgi:hypothetical protein